MAKLPEPKTGVRRSQNMARIRSKNTKPEVLLRSALFKKGFRYRIHSNGLPGKPDIVLKKYNTVIFVHGCFWHQHLNCKEGRIPNTRIDYWKPKLLGNRERDFKHQQSLIKLGWNVLVFWECEIENEIDRIVNKISQFLLNKTS